MAVAVRCERTSGAKRLSELTMPEHALPMERNRPREVVHRCPVLQGGEMLRQALLDGAPTSVQNRGEYPPVLRVLSGGAC